MDILTSNNQNLRLFVASISIDRTLPKYTKVEEDVKKIKGDVDNVSTPYMDAELIPIARGETFEKIKDMDAHTLNVSLKVSDYEHYMTGGRWKLNSVTQSIVPVPVEGDSNSIFTTNVTTGTSEKRNIFARLFKKKSALVEEKKEVKIDHYELDVVEFFTRIKNLAKFNKESYVERIDGYIKAMKMADIAGQEALKERLLRDMVINKYESILYATGNYFAVTEAQAVEFAKKAEKGVSIDYIHNYLRPLSIEAIEKIKEANKLEIFDNYVIMHYDPENNNVDKTHEEKVKEEDKRRDPILFGVIAGSNKLYYITDWEDEYCNLTLDEFVNVLQISKDDVKLPKEIKI